MEDINKEKKIKNGIEPVSIEKTEKIINQMKNCVCKILPMNDFMIYSSLKEKDIFFIF